MNPQEVAQHLIVAADFSFKKHGGRAGVIRMLITLAEELQGSGVVIKANSTLRALGYGLIDTFHTLGLGVMADLKLVDIPNTLEMDGEALAEVKPELVTVMCTANVAGMRALVEQLPETEVLGVTVLTSMDEKDCQRLHGATINTTVLSFARLGLDARLGGLVCSAQEVELLGEYADVRALSRNTPGIRPEWYQDASDDQKRTMTPKEAIMAGADRVIIGRPIVQAENPMDAVRRTLDEIQEGLEARQAA